MKPKKKTAAMTAGALLATGVLTAGCIHPVVYGPPSETPTPAPTPSVQADNNIPVTVYGPPPELQYPSFAPENNFPEDVYGPPFPYDYEEEPDVTEEPDPGRTETTDEDR